MFRSSLCITVEVGRNIEVKAPEVMTNINRSYPIVSCTSNSASRGGWNERKKERKKRYRRRERLRASGMFWSNLPRIPATDESGLALSAYITRRHAAFMLNRESSTTNALITMVSHVVMLVSEEYYHHGSEDGPDDG